MRFTLSKTEILRGFKSFTRVISTGRSISLPPLRCYYLRDTGNPRRMQTGFSVSRSIRRAVDRNRAKRLMRESFRLNKHLLTGIPPTRAALEIVFMFTGPAAELRGANSFSTISGAMTKILTTLVSKGE